MTEQQLMDAMRRLSDTLEPGDLEQTLHRLTAAAVEVLPAVGQASITIAHADGSLDTVGETDQVIRDLDARQYELREGPCYLAASETSHIVARDLATDERFPRYGPAAAEAGIRSQAGIRLFDAPQGNGALNLYSAQVGAFEDLTVLSALFAHQAAVAIAYAGEVGNLRKAMQTRETIGKAVGIVMERYQLTDDRAFAFLTRLSQHRNVKLNRVAEEVVTASHRGVGL
jgi:hypothetical protein